MKKIFVLLLGLAMLLCLAACTQQSQPTVPQDSSSVNTPTGSSGSSQPSQSKPTETTPTNSDSTVPAHSHKYAEAVTAPTCTEKGFTTFTCDCGHSYVGREVAATGHAWGQWETTKQPTESAAGQEVRRCSTCAEQETKDLPKLTDEQLRAQLAAAAEDYALCNLFASWGPHQGGTLMNNNYAGLSPTFVVHFLCYVNGVETQYVSNEETHQFGWAIDLEEAKYWSEAIFGHSYDFVAMEPLTTDGFQVYYDAQQNRVVYLLMGGAGGIGYDFVDYEALGNGLYKCILGEVDETMRCDDLSAMTLTRTESGIWRIVRYEPYTRSQVDALMTMDAYARANFLATVGQTGEDLFSKNYAALSPEFVSRFLVFFFQWEDYLDSTSGSKVYTVPVDVLQQYAQAVLGHSYDFASMASAPGSGTNPVYYDQASASIVMTETPYEDDIYLYGTYCTLDNGTYNCRIQYVNYENYSSTYCLMTAKLLDSGLLQILSFQSK